MGRKQRGLQVKGKLAQPYDPGESPSVMVVKKQKKFKVPHRPHLKLNKSKKRYRQKRSGSLKKEGKIVKDKIAMLKE